MDFASSRCGTVVDTVSVGVPDACASDGSGALQCSVSVQCCGAVYQLLVPCGSAVLSQCSVVHTIASVEAVGCTVQCFSALV